MASRGRHAAPATRHWGGSRDGVGVAILAAAAIALGVTGPQARTASLGLIVGAAATIGLPGYVIATRAGIDRRTPTLLAMIRWAVISLAYWTVLLVTAGAFGAHLIGRGPFCLGLIPPVALAVILPPDPVARRARPALLGLAAAPLVIAVAATAVDLSVPAPTGVSVALSAGTGQVAGPGKAVAVGHVLDVRVTNDSSRTVAGQVEVAAAGVHADYPVTVSGAQSTIVPVALPTSWCQSGYTVTFVAPGVTATAVTQPAVTGRSNELC